MTEEGRPSTTEESIDLIVGLARELPPSLLDVLADACLRNDLATDDRRLAAAVSALPHQSSRELLLRLMGVGKPGIAALDRKTVGLILRTLAKERRAGGRDQVTEIVWTGPLVEESSFRRTSQVLLQLIDSAERTITVVSFAIYRITLIQEALIRAAQRKVAIRIIVESEDESEGKVTFDMARQLGEAVASCSSIYIWPREKREKDARGNSGALHAKCLIVDGHSMFASSANLTEYALSLNLELGLLVTGEGLPQSVEDHFGLLIHQGILVPLQAGSSS